MHPADFVKLLCVACERNRITTNVFTVLFAIVLVFFLYSERLSPRVNT